VEDVVASFTVGIKSGEEGVEGEFPLAFGLVLVFEVVFFEFGADVYGGIEFAADFGDVFRAGAEGAGDHASVDVFAGSCDDFVAGLLDQHDQSGRGVVEFAELIDLQEGVHDGREELGHGREFAGVVAELSEELFEGGEVFVVVVGFDP
jgi:hypothetical protein